MLQFSNSTRNIISGDDFVGANQTIDAFLKHLAKEDEVQATQHTQKRFLRRTWRSSSPMHSFIQSATRTHESRHQAAWFFTTCHLGLLSREIDRVTWRLLISFKFSLWFKGHEQLHSPAMKRGWWFIYDQEPGVDRGLTMCCIKTETNFEKNYLPFRKSSERENHPA